MVSYISPSVEKIYGYKPEEVTGNHFKKFIHPDDLQKVTDLFNLYMGGKDVDTPAYIRAIASDGTERFVRANQTPIIDEGEIKEFNFIITDFTERKRAEEALSIVNNKLNMLSSITRHDILNMIMVIRGYLEMSDETEDKNTLHEYFLKEKEAIDAIQHQIEFTRFYQDIGMNEPKWQNAGKTVDSVAGTLDLEGIQLENSLKKQDKVFSKPTKFKRKNVDVNKIKETNNEW